MCRGFFVFHAPLMGMPSGSASNAASSYGVNLTSADPMFSAGCSGFVVPGIGMIFGFCAIIQPSAI